MMSYSRMSREERDKGLDLRGDEAVEYYNRAMDEATSIIESVRKGYEVSHKVPNKVQKSNLDKPHRCPACHTITDTEHLNRSAIVQCCRCGVQFTRHPVLARLHLLRDLGVVCDDHVFSAGL